MKILCTQEFPGDVRMLGSVAAAAPSDMEFVLLPQLRNLLKSPGLFQEYLQDADALLTCHLWAPEALRKLFPTLPLVFMPHNACPVKAHYWFPKVLQVADLYLCTGNSLRRKTRLLDPGARVVDVPYPRLEEYSRVEKKSDAPKYDLVFACTSYAHYGPLMGIPNESACWHDLIPELATRGFRIAVLKHQDDVDLKEISGVDYFDQPNPKILFAGKAVISDIASNGLIAAALGKPVFQVVDSLGAIEPRLASHRGFLEEVFDIGPRFGRDWTLDNLDQFHPFGEQHGDLWERFQQRISDHINRQLEPSEFYVRLAKALVSFRKHETAVSG
ncbi:MAG: hypothetical protein KOO60_02370 [Gemmatimonadales bacterium]|nr:hypothetical protein [Gemmatimonadales bacterium]